MRRKFISYFHGDLAPEWLSDGRSMKLLNDYFFVDPLGEVWRALKGTIIDGASIPRFFWRVIGGPFEGFYRNASVVHDYYCKAKTRASNRVHLMFYHGIKCVLREARRRGKLKGWRLWLEHARAVFMFLAVRLYGPQFPRKKWLMVHYLATGRFISLVGEIRYWSQVQNFGVKA